MNPSERSVAISTVRPTRRRTRNSASPPPRRSAPACSPWSPPSTKLSEHSGYLCERDRGRNHRVSDATVQATSSRESVLQLRESSDRIASFVTTINTIAEQTNLLALNASIEAARAGDSWKGFAVVAGEVKELANQSGNATEEISKTVHSILESTGATATDIEKVTAVVHQIAELQSAIATAVDQQRTVTGEIGRGIAGRLWQSDDRMQSRLARDQCRSDCEALQRDERGRRVRRFFDSQDPRVARAVSVLAVRWPESTRNDD